MPEPSLRHGFRCRSSPGSSAHQLPQPPQPLPTSRADSALIFPFCLFFFLLLCSWNTYCSQKAVLLDLQLYGGKQELIETMFLIMFSLVLKGAGVGSSLAHLVPPASSLAWWVGWEPAPDVSVHFESLLSSSGLCHSFPHVCEVALDEIQLFKWQKFEMLLIWCHLFWSHTVSKNSCLWERSIWIYRMVCPLEEYSLLRNAGFFIACISCIYQNHKVTPS